MISYLDNILQNQAAAAALAPFPFSPIVRPSCPFQGRRSHSPVFGAGVFSSPDHTALCMLSLSPLRHTAAANPPMRPGSHSTMDTSFEARLGLQADRPDAPKAEVADCSAPGSVVLIVMDANKELAPHALDWALTSVVQKGDTVKLLGVLHTIMNPMGYKSRADENSWNGASRKVLDTEIASHLAMLKSIPAIYSRVEKLGAKLDIEVRAHIHGKHLVVEEAKRLDARYVVIDRHIKKDKKFYIENLTCFVTRVKTATNFEHLRHGVPHVSQDVEEVDHTGDALAEESQAPSQTSSQEFVAPTTPQPQPQPQPHPLLQPQAQQRQAHPMLQPPTPTSIVMSGLRPGDYYYDDSLTFEGGGVGGHIYGPELMGNAYEGQFGAHMAGGTASIRERAVRRWLTESGSRVDPAFDYGPPEQHNFAPDYGHMMANWYPAEAVMHQQMAMAASPLAEAGPTDYMSNVYFLTPYAPHPGNPMSIRKHTSDGPSAHSSSYPLGTQSRSPDSRTQTSQLRHSLSVPTAGEYSAAALPESVAAELRSILDLGSWGSAAPISVQPRRVDASWALDLLSSDLGKPQAQTHVAMPVAESRQASVQSSPPREMMGPVAAPPPPPSPWEAGADDALHGPVDRTSSVRRAVSSKKLTPGTPPLCSVCHQKSPDFGKVRKFSFAELQEATDNFSGENYLAEGGYGSVYKGRLKEGQLVAVKQHKLASSQGDEEFCAEVEVLSCAQHRNLVTLIGYCVENHLRLLVYEYVCNGSLDRHLSPKSRTELQWGHRHKIALGAARALRYLHEECRVGCIVHRDMRPNNILLTHDFTPMVGDFGLARRQSSGDEAEETRVLGTIGYLAPEYAETGKITDKADVYAFGVVLLELITGRKAIDYTQARNQASLTEWARPLLDSYDKALVDPRLRMQYDEYELHCMMHAANQCIKKDPAMRPRMTQVLRILNPPQERDWAYGQGRRAQEVAVHSGPHPHQPGGGGGHYHHQHHHLHPHHELPYFAPTLERASSKSSLASSCSQSDVSAGSHSDANSPSDSEPPPQQPLASPRIPRSKLGGRSKWKLTKDKALPAGEAAGPAAPSDVVAAPSVVAAKLSYHAMV